MAVRRLAVWDEIDDFLLSSPTLEQIMAFRPSESAQTRLRELLEANKTRKLTLDEEAELDETMAVEHFMRRLKVKALVKTQQ
jgi:hypothetical protein